MALDAIIISDTGEESLSGSNPLRFTLDGRTADIQVVLNYLENQGRIVPPIEGDGIMSWSSAPKLNGIYLLGALGRQGFNVELINNYYQERDSFCNLLKDTPRVVIVSTTFIHSKQALRTLVEDIRSLAPDIFIIAGGQFIYLSYLMLERSHDKNYETEAAKDDFLFLNNDDEPQVDLYIISLRGEQILFEALRRIKENKATDDLPNSGRLLGKTYSLSRRIDDIPDAGSIIIDWDSLPEKIFKSGVVPMQASNGCPYNCAYCTFMKDRRLMFTKPIDLLLAELETVSSRGARYVWFVDDNFRCGTGNLKSVCQRLANEGLGVEWMSFIMASALKDIDGELLREAHCAEVQLGLESAEPTVLRNMRKRGNPKLYAEVVRKLLAAGVNCSCYFVFGFPGETDETAHRTREFIKTIEHPELEGNLSWSLFPFILSPISPIYEFDMRKKHGLTGYMRDWKHRTMDSSRAMEHVKATFLELENSGPIYRGDNISIMRGLAPHQRQELVARRHRLSKLALKRQLETEDVVNSFNEVFT